MQTRLIRLLFLTFLSFFPGLVYPYHLQISPPIIELSTRPGCTRTFEVRIANFGTEDVKCELASSNMGVAQDGRTYSTYSDSGRGCNKWLEFRPNAFSLPAGKQIVITCKVRAPGNAVGGYYAMLTCKGSASQAESQRIEKEKVSIPLSVSLSSVLLLSVTAINATAEIRTLEPTLSFTELQGKYVGKKAWQIEVPLKNIGNDHDIVKGKVSILRGNATYEDKADLTAGSGYVLPEQTRTFTAVGHKTLFDGYYVVKMDIFLTKYRKRGEVSFPFIVQSGVITKQEPTPEMLALIEKTRPVFSIDPPEVLLDLPPKARQSKPIQIINITDDTIKAHLEFSGWTQDSSGNVFVDDSHPYSKIPPSYLTIEPDSFVLSPRQHITLKLTWQMPSEAKGELFPAVILVPENKELINESSLILERSVLIGGSAKGTTDDSILIRDFKVNFDPEVGLEFNYSITNIGNAASNINCSIEVLDNNGEKVGNPIQFTENNEFILPGVTRYYFHNSPIVLKPGKFKISLYCYYNSDLPPASKSIYLSKK